MRQRRLTVPPDHPAGFYHCFSRVVDKRHVFGPLEKEHFASLLRECAAFCRVRVLTFAIMGNHFHLLLQVPHPPPPHLLPSPDQILLDLQRLSGHQHLDAVRLRFENLRSATDPEPLARYLASFHARLFNLSAFMKLLKQRFTQWFNVRSGRKGTLWEDRYHSVLVEGSGLALTTMAAYIDLNPVRAGLVRDPKDYRWCGYAQALAGAKHARQGIQFLAQSLLRGRPESLRKSLDLYRLHLHLQGDPARESLGADRQPSRGTLSREALLAALAARGRLPLADYLRCRVRYFCDGAVLGGRAFVDDVFRAYRSRFGPRRRSGARPLKGLSDAELFALRDLRLGVFG